MQPNHDILNAFQLQQQSVPISTSFIPSSLPPPPPPLTHSLSVPPIPAFPPLSSLSPPAHNFLLPPLSPPLSSPPITSLSPTTNTAAILPPYEALPGSSSDHTATDTSTQGLSSHELHQAVLFGAKASDIKKLVSA